MAGSCSIMYDPYGRAGISVVQPVSGVDFPLVNPSADIKYLLADAHFSYDDPSDYDPAAAEWKPPFRIKWISGLGCDPPQAPVITAPNTHDIIVVDANDVVVFDSTDPLVIETNKPWGDRLHVVMWQHQDGRIFNLVYHTRWSAEDLPEPREYPSAFYPENAILDERVVYRMPKRVKSISVLLDTYQNQALDFRGGYNAEITATRKDRGLRRTTRILFDFSPGGGDGVFPGCDPKPLYIKAINNIKPDELGHFFLAGKDCYLIHQPTERISDEESVPTIVNVTPDTNLPHPDAGTAKGLPGWPNTPDSAHLVFESFCEACCDCDDYLNVMNMLKALHDKYKTLGRTAEAVRDEYFLSIEEYYKYKLCAENKPLRITLVPQFCPFIDVGVQFCNHSTECVRDVVLTIDFSQTLPATAVAEVVPGFTFVTGQSKQPGRTQGQTEPGAVGGTWPVYTFVFDLVYAGESVSGRFRLKFNNCGVEDDTPYEVTGCLTATVSGEPVRYTEGHPQAGDPVEVCETKSLKCPPPPGSTFNPLDCKCE